MEITKSKSDILISFSFIRFLSFKTSVGKSDKALSEREHTIPHYSDYPTIWYCRSGKYIHRTEDGDFTCPPGSVVIIPPGMLHQPVLPEGGKADVTCVFLTFNCYESLNPETYVSSITHLLLPRFSKMLGFSPVAFTVLSESSRREAEKLLEAPALKDIEAFFSLPEFQLTAEQKEAALEAASARLYPILHALSHIHAGYASKITAETLCAVTGLCRTNLFSSFKQYLGISHTAYLTMLRVARAQFSIAHTSYSLQYISDKCGFATSSYMSKCYKRYKGFLPKVDRALMKTYRKRYPNIHISHQFFDNE